MIGIFCFGTGDSDPKLKRVEAEVVVERFLRR